MSSDRIKIIEKAIKLRELAVRGEDGEKETAKRMFDAWKEKHGITEYELASAPSEKDSEYFNMTAADFFKHIEVDLRMLGLSMMIYSVGRLFKNEDVTEAGVTLFKEAVKQKKEQEQNIYEQQKRGTV